MLDILSRELLRKALHITGSLIPIVYYFISKENALIILSFINIIIFLIEWLRLTGRIKFSEVLLRPHESKQIAGYIYFQIAALISILVFDKTVAIAALLMLAIGDTAAGLAGAMFKGGNVRNHDIKKITLKPLPVMAIMFTVCVLIGFILLNLPLTADMRRLSLWVYVAGAIGAVLGDAIPVRILGKVIDDNFMIPLLSGLFMVVMRFI